MRKVILYVASSLDNYIARPDGNIDWLLMEQDYGFNDFYKEVDCILMGRKTWDKVQSFEGDFPYKGKECFVFSSNKEQGKNENVKFINSDIKAFISWLKTQPGDDVWLVGGGELAGYLFSENLIDEVIIALHPIILGEGIPLFTGFKNQHELVLYDSKVYSNSLVHLFYGVIPEDL